MGMEEVTGLLWSPPPTPSNQAFLSSPAQERRAPPTPCCRICPLGQLGWLVEPGVGALRGCGGCPGLSHPTPGPIHKGPCRPVGMEGGIRGLSPPRVSTLL